MPPQRRRVQRLRARRPPNSSVLSRFAPTPKMHEGQKKKQARTQTRLLYVKRLLSVSRLRPHLPQKPIGILPLVLVGVDERVPDHMGAAGVAHHDAERRGLEAVVLEEVVRAPAFGGLRRLDRVRSKIHPQSPFSGTRKKSVRMRNKKKGTAQEKEGRRLGNLNQKWIPGDGSSQTLLVGVGGVALDNQKLASYKQSDLVASSQQHAFGCSSSSSSDRNRKTQRRCERQVIATAPATAA